MDLLYRIKEYWTKRAEGYSEVNREELSGDQKEKWLKTLKTYLPDRKPDEVKVLDIGTGPGFFAIILAEAGYQVTAVDYTEEMLEKAKNNANALRDKIVWRQMDAQDLEFEDGSFDVVISRNVTWNLEHPKQAYEQWYRVLREGGLMLNFDANWYAHLYDSEKREAYEADRERVEMLRMEDHYTCTDIDEMEDIARQVILSKTMRPFWDECVLKELGCRRVKTENSIWKRVWSEIERVNYASTPMFLVIGEK